MTSLSGYLHQLMQSRGVTDTLLVSDDAAVLKTRSYAYLPKTHTTKTESKFVDPCAVSSVQAPCCPCRKASDDDFADKRIGYEKKFKATLASSKDIDDMCMNVMRKQRKEHQPTIQENEKFPTRKVSMDDDYEKGPIRKDSLDNENVVREIVSLASSLLDEKMNRDFSKGESLIRTHDS